MKKITTKEFIEKATCILGNNYIFTKTKYFNAHTKVIITCKEHGDFMVLPLNVIQKSCECPECAKKKLSRIKSLTTQEFIKKAIRVHGKKYNYDLVKYISSHDNVEIVCPIHGIFEQSPNNHLRGCGCPKCSKMKPFHFQKGLSPVQEAD